MIDVDPDLQAGQFFDDSSLSNGQIPKLIVICGGVCAGKTTMRCTNYGTGFVVLDAAEILLSLCRGQSLDFPGPFMDLLEVIGHAVADRAVHERRNLVTEVVGNREATLPALLEVFRGCGYQLECVYVDCDMEEAWHRNLSRGEDNISAYFTQEFHERWLLRAAAQDDRKLSGLSV